MKVVKTARGFSVIEFKDRYDNKCSIQDSSLATEDCIWLGIDDANPQIMASQVMKNGTGWVKYPIHPDVSLTTRMHLTQDQAADLIEILERFVDTGSIGG